MKSGFSKWWKTDSNQYTIRYVLGPGSLPLFPPALLTQWLEILWDSLSMLQATLFLWPPSSHKIFLSGTFDLVPLAGSSAQPWEKDRRLGVIKSLLNYLMQDWLACLPPGSLPGLQSSWENNLFLSLGQEEENLWHEGFLSQTFGTARGRFGWLAKGFISPDIQAKWDNGVPVEGHFRISGFAPLPSQQVPCVQM